MYLAALKILLKSGKQIQREFNIQYVPALPDISGSGTSETLGDALIQGFMMEQAFFHIRPKSGRTIAPPAKEVHVCFFAITGHEPLYLQPPHFHQLCDIFCMI